MPWLPRLPETPKATKELNTWLTEQGHTRQFRKRRRARERAAQRIRPPGSIPDQVRQTVQCGTGPASGNRSVQGTVNRSRQSLLQAASTISIRESRSCPLPPEDAAGLE